MIDHIYQNPEFGENWFSYPNLYKSIVDKFESGSKFVEIGSWKGKSSAYMAVEIANSGKDIEFYCVDTWEGSIENQNNPELPYLYDIFKENMKSLDGYYRNMKMTSLQAVKKFENESLDFVFIDGSHEYEDVKKDIIAWFPKVKPGGILAGHDYYIGEEDYCPGVKQAVNEEVFGFDTQENCWIYKVPNTFTIEEKLKNFPSVNFISVDESKERRDLLYEKFKDYGITNVKGHIFKRYSDKDYKIIHGPIVNNSVGKGVLTSHLELLKDWYNNTNEPYTFVCEDDLSLETVKYWNFTWEQFFNSLPEQWNLVQLCLIREGDMFLYFDPEVKVRNRCWCDWSACAYLISREQVKNVIENYYPDDTMYLEYKGVDKNIREQQEASFWFLLPHSENLIYSYFSGGMYSFPLFVEDISFQSIWGNPNSNLNAKSHYDIVNWWKTKGLSKTLNEIKYQIPSNT